MIMKLANAAAVALALVAVAAAPALAVEDTAVENPWTSVDRGPNSGEPSNMDDTVVSGNTFDDLINCWNTARVGDVEEYDAVNKAWYGLKQGGKIAHDDLVEHLKKYGYVRSGTTNGLFKHITRQISFTLVVDDFGIKYEKKEDNDHL